MEVLACHRYYFAPMWLSPGHACAGGRMLHWSNLLLVESCMFLKYGALLLG